MIRQAHTYLFGAVSGTALIAAAVVAFVLLVSFQAVRDWPFAGLVGGDDGGATPASTATQAAKGVGPGNAAGTAAATTPGGAGAAAGGGAAAQQGDLAGSGGGEAAISPTPGGPSTGQGSQPGADSASPSPAGTPKSPGTGGGGGGSGGGNSGGNSGPVQLPNAPAVPSSPGTTVTETAGKATDTVGQAAGGAVDTVDQATGGAVGNSGAGKVVEDTVNGVAGPKSVVGGTVDKTVKAVDDTVGGLLGGDR